MNRSRGRHGDKDQSRTTTEEQLFLYLDQIDGKLDRLLGQSKSSLKLEKRQMAEFSRLNAKVTKISDLAESVRAMHDGIKAERDAALAEVERLKAADAADQGAVDEAETALAIAEAKLEALAAVVAGTPVETGGSTAGNTEASQP